MSTAKRQKIALKVSLIIGGTGTRTVVEIGTVNRDLKIKIGQIAVAVVQNILTKRNKTTMKAEVSVVKIKNCKFLIASYFKRLLLFRFFPFSILIKKTTFRAGLL